MTVAIFAALALYSIALIVGGWFLHKKFGTKVGEMETILRVK